MKERFLKIIIFKNYSQKLFLKIAFENSYQRGIIFWITKIYITKGQYTWAFLIKWLNKYNKKFYWTLKKKNLNQLTVKGMFGNIFLKCFWVPFLKTFFYYIFSKIKIIWELIYEKQVYSYIM